LIEIELCLEVGCSRQYYCLHVRVLMVVQVKNVINMKTERYFNSQLQTVLQHVEKSPSYSEFQDNVQYAECRTKCRKRAFVNEC